MDEDTKQLTSEQEEAGRLIFGDQKFEEIVAEGEEMTRKLEALGIGYKSIAGWLGRVYEDDTGYDYDTGWATLSRVSRDALRGIKYRLEGWRPPSLAEVYFGSPVRAKRLKGQNLYFDGELQTQALEQQEAAQAAKAWDLRRGIDGAFKGEGIEDHLKRQEEQAQRLRQGITNMFKGK